ncbi:MAG: T9SS type A sorting domain-containing protein [Bacteroidetes bacterium]|nr:T9SS type A sorting domain-containing protein [Bacteroidota bacterium]
MNLIFKRLFLLTAFLGLWQAAQASSHREAPLIADDPLADNVDVYAFRSPDRPNTVTLIATYVPLQLPQGGPNYYAFGENIRYEIHIDNNPAKPGDEIIYRVEFKMVNEDPSTFFNVRLGKRNGKMVYTLYRSDNGGQSFVPILQNRAVPPTNIGQRSINSSLGLGKTYQQLVNEATVYASTGEQVYIGPSDDPFFVDLGGIFDLGDAPRQMGQSRDGLACMNVSTIAIQVPISYLRKKGAAAAPANILDPNYVIGVWASASRQKVRTLSPGKEKYSGEWVQVSRLGMPLTNEAVIPIGFKDYWNSLTPYQELADTQLDGFFYNPELGLYMDDALFGGAVPALSKLRIQRKSLGSFDFGNGHDGLYGLKGSAAVAGTALDDAIFGTLLLPGPGKPRSVDLWPIFHTGVPNFPPYQLATGKNGNPLAAGKPFINNFLPNGGDMLRLNMAVPVTPRNDANFSSLGIVQAAVLGLTNPTYANASLQFIPNMDGFPNGRRLEDDVTRIELQAVSGVALAAIGLWYDDFTGGSPVTPNLLNVLTYSTGVEKNDATFGNRFPYVALPWSGDGNCGGKIASVQNETAERSSNSTIGLQSATAIASNYPNPFRDQTTLKLHLSADAKIQILVYDASARLVQTVVSADQQAGDYQFDINLNGQKSGMYYAVVMTNGALAQTLKLNKVD